MAFRSQFARFLTNCVTCGNKTSKAYASQHEGKCKECVTGVAKTPDKSLLCPDCGEHYLTPYQKAHHYHCDWCTRQTDPEGYIRELTTPYEPDMGY